MFANNAITSQSEQFLLCLPRPLWIGLVAILCGAYSQAGEAVSFTADADGIDSIAVSSDGKFLAVGGDTGNVSLWDVGPYTLVRATRVGTAPVLAAKFAPDGKTLAVSDGTTGIRVLAVPELTQKAELRSQDGYVLAIAFSSDGTRLASAISTRNSGAVDLWSMGDRSSQRLTEVPRAVIDVTFSRSDVLAAQAINENTYIWKDGTGQNPISVKTGGEADRRSRVIAFAADGSCLAVAGARELRMVDVMTREWKVANVIDPSEDVGISTTQDEVKDIAFSPDGKCLAMAVEHCTQTIRPNFDGSVHVWTVEPLRRLHTIAVPHVRVNAVEFLPNGKSVVCATTKGRVSVWTLEPPP